MSTPSNPRLPAQQEIRFCTTGDGVRIAYATVGSGTPLVKAANWLNHLEFDWRSPIWRHLFAELTEHHTLIRYDERGNGLSDWNVADLSFESLVADLEAVVEASAAQRFALFGVSQGGPVAVAYAVRHPERVSKLVLHGSYAKGWARRADIREREGREALVTLIRQGWGQDNPVFRQMWSTLYIPEGTREQVAWFNELQRITTSPEIAERLVKVLSEIDVADLMPLVQAPTLVTHCRGDAAVPFEAGRAVAARIPGAKFVELPGRNHLLLEGTPEWDRFRDEVRAFLGDPPRNEQTKVAPAGGRSPVGVVTSVSPASSGQWHAGEQRAHYRIVSALGAGGMGVVYRARDTRLERDVAVKVLPDALTSDPAARARLNREAQAASALNHPNICTIYEVGEAGGHAYIAMEYVEGRALSSIIPSDGLPVESVIRYGEQMADALAHAHDRNVLHRDLKSANVIVTREGRAKILDFGLAKRIGAEIDAATLSQVSPLTQAGAIAGTLHYLPPEMLSGEAADARSDIWSLGVMLYEMASGTLPFQGRTSFEVTSGILREPPAALPARVPPGLRAVIQRCLAKEPGQRYQRASEVRAALEAIGSIGSSPTIVAPEVVKPPAPAAHKSMIVLRNWFLWVAAMIVLFGLFLVVTMQVKRWTGSSRDGNPLEPPATSAVAPRASEIARVTGGGRPSPNPDANAYYEKAMLFMMTRLDLPQARNLLEKSLEADPKFAHARAMYALTHLVELDSGESSDRKWINLAQAEVQQALRDDPNSPAAQAILGAVYVTQGRKELGVPELQRAIQAEPDLLAATVWLMFVEHFNGDYAAAMARAERLRQSMPVFFPAQILYGKVLHETGNTAAAIRVIAGVLEQDPHNHYSLLELARIHTESGDTATARRFLERIRPEHRKNFRVRLQWALLFAREGKRREAVRELDAGAAQGAEACPRVTSEAAEVYARLGDTEAAVEWIDRAVRNGDERIEWFKRDPLLANLQEHPRFKQIIESVEFRRRQRK